MSAVVLFMQPDNMLLDAQGNLHLSDFGCAWIGCANNLHVWHLSPYGTVFYQAPEVFELKPKLVRVIKAAQSSSLAAAACAAAASNQPAAQGSPQGWSRRATARVKAVLSVFTGAPAAHTPAAVAMPAEAAANPAPAAQPPAAPAAHQQRRPPSQQL